MDIDIIVNADELVDWLVMATFNGYFYDSRHVEASEPPITKPKPGSIGASHKAARSSMKQSGDSVQRGRGGSHPEVLCAAEE